MKIDSKEGKCKEQVGGSNPVFAYQLEKIRRWKRCKRSVDRIENIRVLFVMSNHMLVPKSRLEKRLMYSISSRLFKHRRRTGDVRG